MEKSELKTSIHMIIDSFQNEQLLQTVYDFLRPNINTQTGKLWDSLSEEEKNEVMLPYEELENEGNLLDASALFKIDSLY